MSSRRALSGNSVASRALRWKARSLWQVWAYAAATAVIWIALWSAGGRWKLGIVLGCVMGILTGSIGGTRLGARRDAQAESDWVQSRTGDTGDLDHLAEHITNKVASIPIGR